MLRGSTGELSWWDSTLSDCRQGTCTTRRNLRCSQLQLGTWHRALVPSVRFLDLCKYKDELVYTWRKLYSTHFLSSNQCCIDAEPNIKVLLRTHCIMSNNMKQSLLFVTTGSCNSLRVSYFTPYRLPSTSTNSRRTQFSASNRRQVIRAVLTNSIVLSGNTSLEESDPEIFDLLEREKNRQWRCLELIASENFTSTAVLSCLGSVFTNKYSEGLPGARYYGGNEIIDNVERLCQKRALAAFGLDDKIWGVNVQPYSGSPANFAAYTAMLQPHDRIMGLDLPSGGHLTHGFYTAKRRVSATSMYFESLPYPVRCDNGFVDYDELEKRARLFRPKCVIAGGSAYPREWDYERFRNIADESGAFLMVDMAHISGLVATGVARSPFEYSDVVTSTTHKSLRGPRAGIIFYRKKPLAVAGKDLDMEEAVNSAVFPALQGGPHNHQIAALAVQLREVATTEFGAYCEQVVRNAKALAEQLKSHDCKLATNGTDNHIVLWDLRPLGLTGSKAQALFDRCSITLNMNAVHGDKSAMTPGGVRLGTPALTTRGMVEDDFKKVADFLYRGVEIGLNIQSQSGKKLLDFKKALDGNSELESLRNEVERFASSFGIPGFTVDEMKYNQLE